MSKMNEAREYVSNNTNLNRSEYITAFKEMGLTDNSASIYHYLLVRKPAKIKLENRPMRDANGRFLKRTA